MANDLVVLKDFVALEVLSRVSGAPLSFTSDMQSIKKAIRNSYRIYHSDKGRVADDSFTLVRRLSEALTDGHTVSNSAYYRANSSCWRWAKEKEELRKLDVAKELATALEDALASIEAPASRAPASGASTSRAPASGTPKPASKRGPEGGRSAEPKRQKQSPMPPPPPPPAPASAPASAPPPAPTPTPAPAPPPAPAPGAAPAPSAADLKNRLANLADRLMNERIWPHQSQLCMQIRLTDTRGFLSLIGASAENATRRIFRQFATETGVFAGVHAKMGLRDVRYFISWVYNNLKHMKQLKRGNAETLDKTGQVYSVVRRIFVKFAGGAGVTDLAAAERAYQAALLA